MTFARVLLNKSTYLTIAFIITILIVSVSWLTSRASAQPASIDPLPSWNDGALKQSIIEFVNRVTTEGSLDFVPVEDRIATFDNDGTLWVEQPTYIQAMFVLAKLETMAVDEPSLREKQPFKAALERDMTYFSQIGEKEVMELLAATHTNMTQEQFETEVRAFFKTATHPTLGVLYTQLAFKPMVELLEYLRLNDFQTWICSGGGIDFIRTISQQMYRIPPEQAIGSSIKKELSEKNGTSVLWRKPELNSYNDKTVKPVGIDLHIGKRPVFAAGNVRSGGDIAMLTYSQARIGSSFQLLINHDDAEREFTYQEADNASLNAASANDWNVVSIKNDWKTVFTFQASQ